MKLVTDDGIEIAEINKIALNPGDVIVAKMDVDTGEAIKAGVLGELRRVFPDNEVILLSKEIGLEVIGED